jgi:predicted AlkP superfamily phosphohydrolase/phosphomutase
LIAKRVAVIGLDAADFGFLRPWMDAGDLPNLKAFVDGAARGPLRSVNPPISGPAWASFMTGLEPGGHGQFDFVVEDPRTNEPVLSRFDRIRGTKVWDVAGAAGKTSVVVNLPVTWPAPPLRGLMVTGMLTPTGKGFTHPPELEKEVLAAFPGYRCDVDMNLKEDERAVLAQLDALAEMNLGVMRMLLRRGPWDLFIGVFTSPDRCQHLFWDRRETVVRDHYRRVDRCVGELLREIGDDALVLILSDHGFQSLDTKFYMNRWLAERGWLRTRPGNREEAAPEGVEADRRKEFDELFGILRPTEGRRGLLARLFGRGGGELQVDPTRSRAWLHSLLTNGVKINVKGSSPAGIVEPGAEYEDLRDAIVEGLRGLLHPATGKPLFEWVKRREEAYHGPCLDWAPDVVTKAENGRLVFGRNPDPGKVVRVSRHEQGNHSDLGILAVRGPGVRGGADLRGANLVDVMPTLCWALGLPVPPGLDGRVLLEAFEPAVAAANPVRVAAAGHASTPGAIPGPTTPEPTTPEEEEELRKTLEGLGYL